MKRFFTACLLSLLAAFAAAQPTAVPVLTQQQMYQDYDTLVNTLLRISPQPEFRKLLTGFDIAAYYRQNRLKIRDIKSPEAFYRFIRSSLTANQDSHTGLMRTELMPTDMMKRLGISAAAIGYIPSYAVFYTAPANANHLNFQFSYIDGRYYNMRSFTYKNKSYKKGWELTGCNGEPINTYVNSLYPYLNMKWDVVHHRYFSETFFKSFNLAAGDALTLTFKDMPAAGIFSIADSVTFTDDGPVAAAAVKEVVYLPDVKILYIRMPAMDLADTDFYPAQIRQYKDQPISKVVFDIRGNHGGGDWVWRHALSAIIDRPIVISETVIMNRNERIQQLFAGQFDSSKVFNVPLLDGKAFYLSYQGTDTIPPGDSSLGYGGKIYVLQDKYIYSSAGAFSTTANMADNLYTVGELTGAQLGIGTSPAYFELPHSKIIYRIEPVIDYTDVKKPSDILHDHVKIPVSLDLQTLLGMMNDKDRWSTGFLVQKDPYFKAVLTD